MKRIVLALLLLLSTMAGAQRVNANFAGGYLLDARERDSGFWLEPSLRVKRVSASVLYFDEAEGIYGNYREVTPLAKVWFKDRRLAVEGGYAFGFSCTQPQTLTCDQYLIRFHTPVVGVEFRQPLTSRLSFVAHTEFTRTELRAKPEHLKDAGLRFFFGVEF